MQNDYAALANAVDNRKQGTCLTMRILLLKAITKILAGLLLARRRSMAIA